MDNAVCIGIAAQAPLLQVDIRRRDRSLAYIALRYSEDGIEALADFLLGWSGPVRVAIAATGAAAIDLGLLLGQAPGRQVFLVAPDMAAKAADLAHYAATAI